MRMKLDERGILMALGADGLLSEAAAGPIVAGFYVQIRPARAVFGGRSRSDRHGTGEGGLREDSENSEDSEDTADARQGENKSVTYQGYSARSALPS